MKYIKYLIIIVIILTSCSQEVLEVKHIDDRLYTDIEVGVNYTEFVRTKYQKSSDYETIYTHKTDYLVPLVFYYIPLNFNFDSKEKWQIYFEDWQLATENKDYSIIEPYVKNTSVEGYVKDKFKTEPLMQMLSLLVKENSEYFVDGFNQYKRDEWHEVEKVLYSRANYLNEFLVSGRVAEKWQEKSGLSLEEFKISLSYYDNKDIESTGISYYKSVMYYMPNIDVSEAVDSISLEYGDNLIKTFIQPYLKSKLYEYSYLEEPVYEYLRLITQQIIFDYHANLFNIEHEEVIYLPPIVTNGLNTMEVVPYFDKAASWYLEDKKSDKIYLLDDKIHYMNKIYETQKISEKVTLYYKYQYPIIVSINSKLTVLTDSMDAYPEISPSNDKMIFISPYAFEDIGSLYLYDFETEVLEELVEKKLSESSTIKKCKWYDDNTILYIDGFSHGTVTRGGNLNKYDFLTGESEILISFNDYRKEVSDIYFENGKWFYEVILFDEDAINYALQYYELKQMDAE